MGLENSPEKEDKFHIFVRKRNPRIYVRQLFLKIRKLRQKNHFRLLNDSDFWFSEETRSIRDLEPLTVSEVYLAFLESPKYKFLRDTLSYIIMLFLHYALCLLPSTIVFSGLEWAILAFYIGRSLVELKQISGVKQFLTRSRQTEDDDAGFSHFKIFSVYFR